MIGWTTETEQSPLPPALLAHPPEALSPPQGWIFTPQNTGPGSTPRIEILYHATCFVTSKTSPIAQVLLL